MEQLTNVLAFLAMVPGLLPSDSRSQSMSSLWHFHQEVVRPLFVNDQGVSAGSSLLRKMAVKAEGRWWIISLGNRRSSYSRTARAKADIEKSNGMALHSLDHRIWKREEAQDDQDFDPPKGFEEQIQSLLDNLSDKVGTNESRKQTMLSDFQDAGHYRSVLSGQVYRPDGRATTWRLVYPDHRSDHSTLRGYRVRACGRDRAREDIGTRWRFPRGRKMAWSLSGIGRDGKARAHRSGETRRNATVGDQSSYKHKFTLHQAGF